MWHLTLPGVPPRKGPPTTPPRLVPPSRRCRLPRFTCLGSGKSSTSNVLDLCHYGASPNTALPAHWGLEIRLHHAATKDLCLLSHPSSRPRNASHRSPHTDPCTTKTQRTRPLLPQVPLQDLRLVRHQRNLSPRRSGVPKWR